MKSKERKKNYGQREKGKEGEGGREGGREGGNEEGRWVKSSGEREKALTS